MRMQKIVLFLLIVISHSVWGENHIFSLHSYHESYPWTKSQRTGFRTVLNHSGNLYPLYSDEYLDTKRRNFDPDYEKNFVDYLNSKYKGYHPDIIYVSDDNALNFILHNRQKLFPSVPVVFSGINDLSKQDSIDHSSYSGVFEKKELLPNLQLIKTLFPDETELLVIGDGATSALITQHELERDIGTYRDLNVRFINNPDLNVILNDLREYKGKAVILSSIGGFRTSDGRLMTLKHAIKQIAESGHFVTFGLEDNYIQFGVLGGYATDGNSQGTRAGESALQILTHPGAPLPAAQTNSNRWIFDLEALDKYEVVLPDTIRKQSTLLNRPRTFFQTYQEFLIDLLYGVSGALVVAILLFNRHLYFSRKQISERKQALIKVTESLNQAQKIAHMGNWEWDVRANSLWWSDEIYRIFGIQKDQFAATYEAFTERIHPDDRTIVHEAVNESLRRDSDYQIEHRILKSDGTIRYVLEEGHTERDHEGNPLRMIGIVRDITEHKTAQEALEKSERKYRALVENAMIGIYRSDLSGTILYTNPALATMLSCNSAEEMIGKNASEIYFSPEERESFVQELITHRHVSNYELIARNKDNLPIPVMVNAALDGDVITGMMIDIREIKKSQKEIEKLSKTIEQIDDTVAITDQYGIITYVNPAFHRHTGYSKEEVIGKTSRILKSGRHDQAFYEELWKTILSGEIFRGTLINRKKNGDLYYENKTITPLKDEKGNLTGFVTTGKDVTLETQMLQQMEQMATTDKLTGIYNRHKFEELFILEAERARRFSLSLSMLVIDIDHFKSINDTYGHDTGDDILRRLCTIVGENVRKIDIFARWGGEEFLVLSPGTDLENIQKLAEKLRLAVENSTFPKIGRMTISIGVSTFWKNDTFSTLFKRADQGLYDAKLHGRNRIGIIEA